MTHAVLLSPLATQDLIALHGWILESADRAIADAYLDRIEQKIASLAESPLRGISRDDLAAGVRTLVFERRLLIAYRVDNAAVIVLRVISGQRELAPLLER